MKKDKKPQEHPKYVICNYRTDQEGEPKFDAYIVGDKIWLPNNQRYEVIDIILWDEHTGTVRLESEDDRPFELDITNINSYFQEVVDNDETFDPDKTSTT